MVNVVSRERWGSKGFKKAPSSTAITSRTEFFVHYHGSPPPVSVGVQVPRNIEKIHRDNGWQGIGYNFVVDQAGTIYEGRGWGLVGAHCPGHNRSGIGVYVAVGGDQNPTKAALNSVVDLYDEAVRRSGKQLKKMGHRDGAPTKCPGERLYAWVRGGMQRPSLGGGASAPVGGGSKPAPQKPAPQKPGPAPSGESTIARDEKSERVRKLQREMNRVFPAYSRLATDGSFGPATEKVITTFQRKAKHDGKYRSTIDGRVGTATRKALRAYGITL